MTSSSWTKREFRATIGTREPTLIASNAQGGVSLASALRVMLYEHGLTGTLEYGVFRVRLARQVEINDADEIGPGAYMNIGWQELKKRGFTDQASRIVMQLRDRALHRGIYPVLEGPSLNALALWTIVRSERRVGLVALETLRVGLDELAQDLVDVFREHREANPLAERNGALIFQRTGQPVPPINYEALLDPFLRRAEQEARTIGHNYVGSEHLVLAVISSADSRLSTLMRSHGITHERVKQAILKLLGRITGWGA